MSVNGRHFVHEARELLDVHVGEQVRARREQLPELHVRRAELLECIAELAGAFDGRRALADHTDFAQHAEELPATRHARRESRA
jgi:hypothetical protein